MISSDTISFIDKTSVDYSDHSQFLNEISIQNPMIIAQFSTLSSSSSVDYSIGTSMSFELHNLLIYSSDQCEINSINVVYMQ